MFKTYVINLKRDIENFYILEKKLNTIGINPIRFNAIYGKEIKDFSKYDKYLSKYCKYLCPRGLVGCALSHYTLLDQIHKNYLKNKDTEYTLILEDDAIPLIKDKKVIEDIIPRIPKNCDILLLYCMGICNYNKSNKEFIKNKIPNGTGSAASYIVKNSSIPKLLRYKIYTHIDAQWYNTISINSYIYNRILFNVDNTQSYNTNLKLKNLLKKFYIFKLDNITLIELLLNKVFRIPLLNFEFTAFEIILSIIILIILYYISKKKFIKKYLLKNIY
tara:strand:+ start:751 stop:1575 length:825 start_codon:yes stop_codon:yes gene_type:complete